MRFSADPQNDIIRNQKKINLQHAEACYNRADKLCMNTTETNNLDYG